MIIFGSDYRKTSLWCKAMNYLKKKINKHKASTRNHDDDDVYDYIPAVPPHPSELGGTCDDVPDVNGLSEEEVAKREEKRRQLEEKRRQQEEAKKSQEAWKFFEQLNQRVSDTVSKTQTVIDTLKDSTTADELIKEAELELGFAAPDSDDEIPEKGATFSKGSWVGFDDRTEAPEPKKSLPTSTKSSLATTPVVPVLNFFSDVNTILAPDPVALPEQPSLVSDLFENFAFESETPVPVTSVTSDDADDPFDTSYVSVSIVDKESAADVISSSEKKGETVIVNGKSAKDYSLVNPANIDLRMETKNQTLSTEKTADHSVTPELPLPPGDPLPDPDFDTDVTDLYLQQNKKIHVSRYGSTTSLASILSNPFLNDDFQDDFNPDNVSGSASPKRRGSTNPFEDSPAEEVPATGAEASAIAALTADFCLAIETADDIKKEDPVTPEPITLEPERQIEEQADQEPEPETASEPKADPEEEKSDLKPQETDSPQRVKFSEAEPETIVVPDSDTSPEPTDEETGERVDEVMDETSSRSEDKDCSTPPPPPPSAEPFDPFATIVDDHNDDESMADHLNPPSIPDYPSDVSDVEEAETRTVKESDVRSAGSRKTSGSSSDAPLRRRSSACEARTAFNHSSKRSSLSSNSSRRASVVVMRSKPFDPFQQVDEDSATPRDDEAISVTDGHEDNALSTAEPSPRFVNQGFEDFPPPDEEEELPAEITAPSEGRSEGTEEKMDEESFPEPPPPLIQSDDRPDFLDPNIDPFDTSNFSFEAVADAVKVTDEGTFDAFTSRFEKTAASESDTGSIDAFASPLPVRKGIPNSKEPAFDNFDPYAGTRPPASTPIKKPIKKEDSDDSFDDDDGEEHFKIVIKAKMRDPVKSTGNASLPMPLLPPPPKTPVKSRDRERGEFDEFESFFTRKTSVTKTDVSDEKSPVEPSSRSTEDYQPPVLGDAVTKRRDSTDSPSTPLFDTDVSQPLEEFPAKYQGDGWEMFIRYPAKKKFTGQRFWKKIFVRVSENSVLQLFNTRDDSDPFQELPLQPSYSLSEISAQQYDQFGKIFTVKLQYIFYRERVGVRKGQIAKVMTGQVTSFGSIAKLGMPLDHAPQVSELIKLGTLNYAEAQSLQQVVEELLFRMPLHRDRALTYKTEEIQLTVADEYYVEQNRMGIISKQLARVRIFFVAFLNGMPGVEIGVNDLTRQGKEIVGRYDIIPVVTEEWIRLEDYEFHSCVMVEEFEKTRTIRLIPPDACYFELMRFRVRPPRNRELPLQVTCNMYITKTKVELRCEVLVPGAVSRKHGQIPCEDIVIRVHMPECWIYFFRTEKHMRFGSVKSAARRPGKIKVRITNDHSCQTA